MMIKIYSKSIREKGYFTPLYSFASLLALGFLVGVLIIPFAIAYVSGPFWIKTNNFIEQPKILLQQNVFSLFEGFSSSLPLQIIASSDYAVTQQLDEYPRALTIKTWDVDVNADGIVDWFWMNVTVPVSESESIHHVRLAFSYQFSLSRRIRLLCYGMGVVDIASPLAGSGVSADGFLELVQSELVTDGLDYVDINPIFNFDQFFKTDIDALSWTRIVSNYLDRKVRPVYNPHVFWNQPAKNDGSFSISLKIRVPSWNVIYRPAILEVLKAGWIQYITTFFFSTCVLYLAWDYLISNQIINTVSYQKSDSAKPKIVY